MRGIQTTILALGLVGCAGPKGPPREPEMTHNPPDPGFHASDLAANEGKTVFIKGKAENAKMGAVLLIDDVAVYIGGLESGWPAELEGQVLDVSGKLVRKQVIPEATVGPNGEISQGGSGGADWVIEDGTWQKAP